MEVKAKKALGQHFLSDDSVINHLVRCIAPRAGENLLEIGAGLGALTMPVLSASGALAAVEFDSRVIEPLQKKCAPLGQLTVYHADILQVQLANLSAPFAGKWRLIGNLPYNLSSPILFHCLAQRDLIVDAHFMLQKEVVDRLCARENEPAYGRLSLMAQLWCMPEWLFDIPPTAFSPPPKVESSVVRLVPRPQPAWPIDDWATFDRLVRVAFSQRRKMLRKSLQAFFSVAELEDLAILPTARPENLSGSQFATLSNAFYRKGNSV